VDGDSKTAADGKTSYTPRTSKELQQIESLVKTAIGFDAKRGDAVDVVNMPFARLDVGPMEPAPQPLLGLSGADWFKIIEAAILSLTALLIGFFVVRPLISRMFAPMGTSGTQMISAPQSAGALPAPQGQHASEGGGGQIALPPPRESMIDISRIEGQVRESSIKKIGEVVEAHPEEALAILRTWLHQPV
jgi:flagellar M-ring protein FliF